MKKKYKIIITWHSLIQNIKKYETILKKKYFLQYFEIEVKLQSNLN